MLELGAWSLELIYRTQPAICITLTRQYAIVPATGMVKIHAQTMRSTTFHLIALKRFAQPTPMMEAEMLCVVETGMPSHEAMAMTVAELASAAKPLIGC